MYIYFFFTDLPLNVGCVYGGARLYRLAMLVVGLQSLLFGIEMDLADLNKVSEATVHHFECARWH